MSVADNVVGNVNAGDNTDAEASPMRASADPGGATASTESSAASTTRGARSTG